MASELVRVDPERFAVAWHDDRARAAHSLTEAWLASFRSVHTQKNYRRDLMAWLAWCEQCRVEPADARIAHADMWIATQRRDGAAEASIARRISAVASWYSYLIDNTGQDPVPLATHNPARTRARRKIDPDYSLGPGSRRPRPTSSSRRPTPTRS
jgi:integrase/recombinase XerD